MIKKTVLLLMFVCSLLGTSWAVTITIDGNDENQTMDGFGTSVMNWDSTFNCDEDFYRIYTQDLGCSIIRGELHPAAITGECMNLNETQFGPDIDANVALMDFEGYTRISITGNWMEAVYNQRLDEMLIMLSIWTPPHWMKTDAEFSESQGCQSYGGYLTRTHENRTNFARYVAAWIKGFSQTYNVPIDALSVQNELDWAHPVESWTTSCVYHSAQYPEEVSERNDALPLGINEYNIAVNYIHDELNANGIYPLMMGPERSHIHTKVWELGKQMAYIEDMANDGTMDIMDGLIHHGYHYEPGNREILYQYMDGYQHSDNTILDHTGIRQYNKRVWQTEANTDRSGWDRAMKLARTIHDQLIALDLSGYIQWSFSAEENKSWAFVLKPTKTSPVEKLEKYYGFKHFSRYIRPGSVRLGCSPDDPDGLSVSAYRHEANGTLTVVAVNAGSSQQATIQLPDAPADISSFQVFTSQSGSVWQESTASVSGNSVSVSVPGNGLVTMVGQGTPTVPIQTSRQAATAADRASLAPRVQLRLNGSDRGLFVANATTNGKRLLDLKGRMMQPDAKVRR
ncbi:MAG: hypothetical protein GF331_21920 [Chitinivibrionales bacterium]|nr:hypothetical protein [Chitinivibrionales bacterium]